MLTPFTLTLTGQVHSLSCINRDSCINILSQGVRDPSVFPEGTVESGHCSGYHLGGVRTKLEHTCTAWDKQYFACISHAWEIRRLHCIMEQDMLGTLFHQRNKLWIAIIGMLICSREISPITFESILRYTSPFS